MTTIPIRRIEVLGLRNGQGIDRTDTLETFTNLPMVESSRSWMCRAAEEFGAAL